ncbi:FecCD family ABC transporter permease [Paenibacillus puerhi]|uniref:FecCD family ABC transporter permease n=1 Tax=Paenibacillus puerhi TaxID=2692622 RepID=UPI00135A2604|nr:iron ABC transporter permease [Paenibacillus puerhi]
MKDWIQRKRWQLWLVLLAAANLTVIVFNLVMGEREIPVIDAVTTALGLGSGEYRFTVMNLRLPRVVAGFLVGSGLAASGVILQAVTGNPLASPGVIGLNAGAAAAAVAVIVLVPSFPAAGLPFAAFAGALLAAVLIYVCSWRRGSSPSRMLVVGIGISAMAGALITYLMTIGGIFRVTQAAIWMAGSLYGRSWEQVGPLLPWILVLVPLVLFMAASLDAIQLGEAAAVGLGVPLERTRGALVLISVGLAGAAVSVAGTVSFVGLMAPHLARLLVGNRSVRLLPAAALMGGFLVLLADLIGRTAFPPYEIPVGLVTALIGAPFMIYLLLRRKPI